MEWWRCKHGAPNDPKWRVIATEAQSRPGDVWAVFTALCDRASQAEDRGSIEGYDPEEIAAGFGYDTDEVKRICNAMKRRGLFHETKLAGWERHQPQRERLDHSTDRVRAFRERQKSATPADETPRNAVKRHETPREEESREDNNLPPSTPQGGGEALPRVEAFPTATDLREATDHWNTVAAELGLPQIERLTGKREKHLRARLRELEGLGPWFGVVNSIRGSPLLTGQKTKWKASFDWVVNPSNFQKLIEGNYAGV